MISQFVAHDIKLELIVIDNSKIEEGFLTVQERFIDCIALAKDKTYQLPELGKSQLVEIEKLWKWDVKVSRKFE